MSEAPGALPPILIVDDDHRVRQTIRWALEDEGLVSTEAADVRQALEVAVAVHPSLVLLDYGLPDGDGSLVADGLRLQLNPPPRILLITADGRSLEKGRRVGAFGILAKPFEVDRLLELVRQGLGA